MKVLVGSTNPVKVESVKEAFSKYFKGVQAIGMKADSKVPEQPKEDETFEGAKNRALFLKKMNDEKNLGADFFVGLEGGITKRYSQWFAFGGMCIIDSRGRIGFGASPHIPLPDGVVKELLSGKELGVIMDEVAGDSNVKQKYGAMGFFTKGVLDRKGFYVDGLIAALAPFVSEEFYFKK
jgi:inosine/xanthosine triphosphatase